MRNRLRPTLPVFIIFVFISGAWTENLLAQTDRIRAPIVSSQTVELTGHVPPRARPEFDQGPVAGSFPLAGHDNLPQALGKPADFSGAVAGGSAESGIRRLSQVAYAGAIRRSFRR